MGPSRSISGVPDARPARPRGGPTPPGEERSSLASAASGRITRADAPALVLVARRRRRFPWLIRLPTVCGRLGPGGPPPRFGCRHYGRSERGAEAQQRTSERRKNARSQRHSQASDSTLRAAIVAGSVRTWTPCDAALGHVNCSVHTVDMLCTTLAAARRHLV